LLFYSLFSIQLSKNKGKSHEDTETRPSPLRLHRAQPKPRSPNRVGQVFNAAGLGWVGSLLEGIEGQHPCRSPFQWRPQPWVCPSFRSRAKNRDSVRPF